MGLYVGRGGVGNSLVISNGGQLISNPTKSPNYTDSVGYFGFSSNNSVIVTGPNSLWENGAQTFIGFNGRGNSLVVSNGGRVTDSAGYVDGEGFGYKNHNSALITGSGSVWSNAGTLTVSRQKGGGNSLAIRNGGLAISVNGSAGDGPSNTVLVADSGSVWSNSADFTVGGFGEGNTLVISNAGQVVNAVGYIARSNNSTGNLVRVADTAVWQNNTLYVGYLGSGNSLFVSGGWVMATNIVIGFASAACNNLLQLDSGNVIVTNATHDAVFEVRQGKYVQNGGTLQVDRFVMTNACAQFIRTGSTLIYGTAVLDPNRDDDGDGLSNGYEQSHGLDPLNAADANTDSDGDGMSNLQEYLAGTDPTNSASTFRIVEIAPMGDDMLLTWTTVGGKKYAVQTAVGDYTNDFIELAPVIIAPGSGESTLSVIHLGGATNVPSRFYRVRLAP
jgi:T5SS/PEP-CTERM-associated repeat protein